MHEHGTHGSFSTMRSISLRLLGVLALVVPGDRGVLAQAPASTVTDSAGVRIVRSTRPAWTATTGWSLSAKPALLFADSADGANKLNRIAGVIRLSDGRVVVAESRDMQLRVYDARGTFVQTIGRRGSRAGEFTDIVNMTRMAGDTLAVESAEYTSFFAPDGRFVRRVRYGPFDAGLMQSPFTAVVGRFANGTAVVADIPPGRRAGGAHWIEWSTLVLVDTAGSPLRPVDRIPSVAFGAHVNAPVRLTFGPELVQASASNHVYIGFGNDFSIREYDDSWTLRRIIRRAWSPTALTKVAITTYVDEWMTLWSTDKGAVRDRDRLARLNASYPDSLPAFVDMLAMPSGELWLREPELKGASRCACLTGVTVVPSKWMVFDANGRWLGRVTMPLNFTPSEIGRDYVLGTMRDANNVARIAMYKIQKPR